VATTRLAAPVSPGRLPPLADHTETFISPKVGRVWPSPLDMLSLILLAAAGAVLLTHERWLFNYFPHYL